MLSRPGFPEGLRGLLGGLASILSVESPGSWSTFVILLEIGISGNFANSDRKNCPAILFC